MIEQCLDGLPAAQREVFVSREMEGAETPEICKILGISATNMSVMLLRARVAKQIKQLRAAALKLAGTFGPKETGAPNGEFEERLVWRLSRTG